jgi:hypothetical protein
MAREAQLTAPGPICGEECRSNFPRAKHRLAWTDMRIGNATLTGIAIQAVRSSLRPQLQLYRVALTRSAKPWNSRRCLHRSLPTCHDRRAATSCNRAQRPVYGPRPARQTSTRDQPPSRRCHTHHLQGEQLTASLRHSNRPARRACHPQSSCASYSNASDSVWLALAPTPQREPPLPQYSYPPPEHVCSSQSPPTIESLVQVRISLLQ